MTTPANQPPTRDELKRLTHILSKRGLEQILRRIAVKDAEK